MDGQGDGENATRKAMAPAPAVFKAPRLVSRPKPPAQQEEDMGYDIRLGDFEDVHALSVSEARAVVTAIHDARKRKDPENNPLRDRPHNDNQTIIHFLDYLDTFSRFKDEESLHTIAALFDTHPELTTVERALLGTLTPDGAEEAFTLIPSLTDKLHQEELEDIILNLNKIRASIQLDDRTKRFQLTTPAEGKP